jgi:hypothetical protein
VVYEYFEIISKYSSVTSEESAKCQPTFWRSISTPFSGPMNKPSKKPELRRVGSTKYPSQEIQRRS